MSDTVTITINGKTFGVIPERLRMVITDPKNLGRVITGVDDWQQTPQGFGFWDRVTDPNPPETMVIQAVEALVTFLRLAEKVQEEARKNEGLDEVIDDLNNVASNWYASGEPIMNWPLAAAKRLHALGYRRPNPSQEA